MTGPPISASSDESSAYVDPGAVKFCERCLRIGDNRSSSSRRGSARAVFSNAESSRRANSPMTIDVCSRAGTYAIPRFRSTRRCSTSSGTRVHSILNQESSSGCAFRRVGATAASSAASSSRSSFSTRTQSRASESMKSCRSRVSLLRSRVRKSWVSRRVKRRRRSSVAEKARRKIKWE